jgi:hypothetical protein
MSLQQNQIIVDEDNYHMNSQALNLAVLQCGPNRDNLDFPIRLDIPRLNMGICRKLAVPFMGDEYIGVQICVNMWVWRELRPATPDELTELITCPIREIKLWKNGNQIYSCKEFRICDDGFGGPGIVLGPGKLISVIFAPCLDMPIINRLHDRYDDYVLDVEFKIKTELENGEKPNFTLKLATAQLLTRVYSNERRREKLGK